MNDTPEEQELGQPLEPKVTEEDKNLTSENYEEFRRAIEILYIKGNIGARTHFIQDWPGAAHHIFGDELIKFDTEGTDDIERRLELEDLAESRRLELLEVIVTLEEESVVKGVLQVEHVDGVIKGLGRDLSMFLYAPRFVDRIFPPPPEEKSEEGEDAPTEEELQAVSAGAVAEEDLQPLDAAQEASISEENQTPADASSELLPLDIQEEAVAAAPVEGSAESPPAVTVPVETDAATTEVPPEVATPSEMPAQEALRQEAPAPEEFSSEAVMPDSSPAIEEPPSPQATETAADPAPQSMDAVETPPLEKVVGTPPEAEPLPEPPQESPPGMFKPVFVQAIPEEDVDAEEDFESSVSRSLEPPAPYEPPPSEPPPLPSEPDTFQEPPQTPDSYGAPPPLTPEEPDSLPPNHVPLTQPPPVDSASLEQAPLDTPPQEPPVSESLTQPPLSPDETPPEPLQDGVQPDTASDGPVTPEPLPEDRDVPELEDYVEVRDRGNPDQSSD